MKYEYNGEVECVQETQTFGANFQKRDLVCREELGRSGKFQYLPFTFTKENVTKLDGINPGDRVKIAFYLDGSKQPYNGRYFAQFTGVDVTVVGKGGGVSAPAPAAAPAVQHVLGTSMQTAVAEFKAWKGDDKALFAKFCKDLVKDAAGNPKPSKEYGAGDWATVVNAIRDAVAKTVSGGATSPSMDDEDMPF